MGQLSENRLESVYNAAVGAGLIPSRNALLAGVDPAFVATLPHESNPAAQIHSDINALNETEPLLGGSNPLQQWLKNAKRLAGPRQQSRVFEQALADLQPGAQAVVAAAPQGKQTQLHPFDELPLRFDRPAVRQLLDIFIDAYSDDGAIAALMRSAQVSMRGIEKSNRIEVYWQNVLAGASKQDRLRPLVDEALKDVGIRAYHDRLRGLQSPVPVVLSEGRDSKEIRDWKPSAPPAENKKERIIGKSSTLLNIGFLEQGLQLSRSIVRLDVDYGSSKALGTGFLIAPDMVLSNHHVLFDEEGDGSAAIAVNVWFQYELDTAGNPRQVDSYTADPSTIRGDLDLDWAMIRLREPLRHEYAPIPFKAPSRPIKTGNRVYIIQHPRGTYKQIGMHHNEVVSMDDKVIQYLTDTETGSSGAPVFNERWELVALHHSWVEAERANGTPEYRNEGIRIESILANLGNDWNASK